MGVLSNLSSTHRGIASGAFFWNVIGAVVLAVILARWSWIWFAPHPISVLPVAESASPEDAGRLFGVNAAATDQTMPLANINLIGVFAGHKGFAIFELDGKRQVGVAAGGDISSGLKLLETASDHVIVGRSGTRQRVELKSSTLKIEAVPRKEPNQKLESGQQTDSAQKIEANQKIEAAKKMIEAAQKREATQKK